MPGCSLPLKQRLAHALKAAALGLDWSSFQRETHVHSAHLEILPQQSQSHSNPVLRRANQYMIIYFLSVFSY